MSLERLGLIWFYVTYGKRNAIERCFGTLNDCLKGFTNNLNSKVKGLLSYKCCENDRFRVHQSPGMLIDKIVNLSCQYRTSAKTFIYSFYN